MTVLVTGGSGLIGMAVRAALGRHGHDVAATDITTHGRDDPDLALLSVENVSGLERLAEARGCDAIVHCAAISGPMHAKGRPLDVVDTNIRATATLLDLARRRNMRRVVLCSSISVYGDAGAGLIDEDRPLHPTSIYGASKIACDALVDAFAAEYGLDGISLRIARVYGPYRRGDCLIRRIVDDALLGQPSEIPCDPALPYHYVHADDVADAVLAALTVPLPTEGVRAHRAFTVSGLGPATMPEVVAALHAVMPDARVTLVDGEDPVSDRQDRFNLNRISRDLGWQPRIGLEHGIALMRDAVVAGSAAT